jgi:hypothetical protein
MELIFDIVMALVIFSLLPVVATFIWYLSIGLLAGLLGGLSKQGGKTR